MNCAYEPGTSPNTGMFFMPELHLNVELAAASASGKLTMHYEVEYVIEFRGSLQWCLIYIFTSVMSNMSGVNVNPEVAKNRIFCSCCGGDLDVDEVVREK